MSVIKFLSEVPEIKFLNSINEVKQIDWSNLPYPDSRSRHPYFQTSTTLHLRTHKMDASTPLTIEHLSQIIECADSPVRELFPMLNELVNWTCKELKVTNLGRIMLVKLAPGGQVPVHIDKGRYFEQYYRLHIPIQTSPNVYFISDEPSEKSQMHANHLYQLFNHKPHGVVNHSGDDRIHLIIDADSEDSRLNL